MLTATPIEWQQPALHPIYLRLLCALLTQRGIDTVPIMQGARLSRRLIDDDRMIAFAPAHDVITTAIERSACPWLGLAFGTTAQVHTHGIVGTAALSSSTLDVALVTIARFAGLRTRAVRFAVDRGDAETTLRIIPNFDLGAAAGFMLDALLVIIERMLEALSGQRLRSARYRLPQASPPWAGRYRSYLGGEVEFGHAGWPALSFDQTFLDQACLTADPRTHAQATRDCAHELDRIAHGSTLTQQVQALLRCCGERYPGAAELAAQLHLSPRSLFRKLAAEGASYQDLVDLQRREHACWLLDNTTLPVERIAERLGYADTSNFSRSFRRWLGVTPREFRQRTTP